MLWKTICNQERHKRGLFLLYEGTKYRKGRCSADHPARPRDTALLGTDPAGVQAA